MTVTRRTMMAMMAASGLPVAPLVLGQSAALLPLRTPGLDHLDVIVPDVEKTTRFYMGLFRTTLHAQPFQGAQRYFVLLGPLPENRAVGYLAIGASRGRGTYIGHFCTSVEDWRRDSAAIFAAMKEKFSAAGLGEFPGSTGVGGIFEDPDGIEIQFLPSPDTLVTVAVPSDLVPGGQGMVTPLRVDHALLNVSNLKRAVAYYRVLYGKESRLSGNSAVFTFRNGSRLLLEQASYSYGRAQTRIARYGIRVNPFDREAVAKGIAALGGAVISDDGKALRLRDVDGIELDLVTGA
ncbi:MAG: VOC family protein [Proteobacteria bacterium]|jgi:catechol 2,3-dioxygenase-like lactoylglutathione lyase family enzyme|nr:VOC family protein [Pseudomonadota bacterium]MBK9250865.1 VOC family protein [Pseudomonadota bacterium]MCC6631518.1 VOC family protein [Gammaproteobacteria bacterium]